MGPAAHGTVVDDDAISASAYDWERSFTVDQGSREGWAWRVRARIAGAWQIWSPQRSFQVDPPGVPVLVSPAVAAVLDNGCSNGTVDELRWEFDWLECPGASRYHLFVIGPEATVPIVDDSRVEVSGYTSVRYGFVSHLRDRGWKWRVRARRGNKWTAWSEERPFDLEDVNTDCPPAG